MSWYGHNMVGCDDPHDSHDLENDGPFPGCDECASYESELQEREAAERTKVAIGMSFDELQAEIYGLQRV